MKRILILIIGLIGVAQAQFAPTSAKSAFKWGVSIGTRDSTAYAANDSLVVVINRQGRMMYRSTDGYWKILSNVGVNDYVPYNGANANVFLGGNRIKADAFDLRIPSSSTDSIGRMRWNADDLTMNIGLTSSVVLQSGQEMLILVKNQTGTTIPNGTVVRQSGVVGASGRLKIEPFLANGVHNSNQVLGLATEDIPNGADGFVAYFGKVNGLNTAAYPDSTILYASSTVAGALTDTVPEAPNNIVKIGTVVKSASSNGIIFTRVVAGSNINQDEGVQLTNPLNNSLLVYDSLTTLWKDKTLVEIGAVRVQDTADMLSNYRRTSTKITNSDLVNSTISGVSLGSNLNNHLNGYGISGTAYNGALNQTWTADTTVLSTKNNVTASLLGYAPLPSLDNYIANNTKWSTSTNRRDFLYGSKRFIVANDNPDSAGVVPLETLFINIDKDFALGVRVGGKLTADTIVKFGGTSSQLLMADGSLKDTSLFATTAQLSSYPLISSLGSYAFRSSGLAELSGAAFSGAISGTTSSFTSSGYGTVGSFLDASNSGIKLEANALGGFNKIISDGNQPLIVTLNGTERARFNASTTNALQIEGSGRFIDSVFASSFIRSGGTSSQFLKADGSIDGTAYGTGSVTSVATNNGSGITGGTITSTGTLAIDTVLISTRAWRQKAVDSLNGLINERLRISDTATILSGYKTYYPRTAISAGTGISYNAATGVITNSSPSSGGTVTSVSAGTGMSFTTITSSGAVNADTTVLSTRAYAAGLDVAKANTSLNNVNGVLSSTYGGAGSVSGILKANGSGVVSAAVNNSDFTLLNGTGFVKMSGTTPSYVTGASSQFVKADGSLDGNTYATTGALSGYLPLSGGTLTGSLSGTSLSMSGEALIGGAITNGVDKLRVAGSGLFTSTGFGTVGSFLDVSGSGIKLAANASSGFNKIISDGNQPLIFDLNGGERLRFEASGENAILAKGYKIDGDNSFFFNAITSGANQQIRYRNNGTDKWQIYLNTANNNLSFYSSANTADRFVLAETGGATFSSSVTAGGILKGVGFNQAISLKTSNYTLTSSDYTVFFNTTSGALTATLPAGVEGRIYNIGYSVLANQLTITPNGSETINGDTSFIINSGTCIGAVTIQFLSGNWYLISTQYNQSCL